MTNDQYDSHLQAIIEFAEETQDIEKLIRFVKKMQIKKDMTEKEKTSDTPQK